MARKLGMDRYVEICATQNIEIQGTIEDLLLRLKSKQVTGQKRCKDSISLETLSPYNRLSS